MSKSIKNTIQSIIEGGKKISQYVEGNLLVHGDSQLLNFQKSLEEVRGQYSGAEKEIANQMIDAIQKDYKEKRIANIERVKDSFAPNLLGFTYSKKEMEQAIHSVKNKLCYNTNYYQEISNRLVEKKDAVEVLDIIKRHANEMNEESANNNKKMGQLLNELKVLSESDKEPQNKKDIALEVSKFLSNKSLAVLSDNKPAVVGIGFIEHGVRINDEQVFMISGIMKQKIFSGLKMTVNEAVNIIEQRDVADKVAGSILKNSTKAMISASYERSI